MATQETSGISFAAAFENANDGRVGRSEALLVLVVLFLVLALNVPGLGAGMWAFHPSEVHTSGTLGWVVELVKSRWDIAMLRACVVGAMGFVALCAVIRGASDGRWKRGVLVAIAVIAVCAALVPAVLTQVALREGTAPWFYTNDSTYQIELAGDLALHGVNPYGHDYGGSGMARVYTLNGTVVRHPDRVPSLHHYPYFPGSVALSAVWRSLPAPWNDYRLLVTLSTLLLIPASLLFPGPFGPRLALGVVLACNPVAIWLAWFGIGDAPCVLGLVVAFGLATRSRWRSAAAVAALAITIKQFAIVAVPFLGLMVLLRGSRRDQWQSLAVGGTLIAVVFAPFLVSSPTTLWQDTIEYGAATFHLISLGLAGLLTRLGFVHRNGDNYPFFALVLICWVPVTAYAMWAGWRSQEPWMAGAGFTLSIFTLIFIGRVFQPTYIVYPITGGLISLLLALEKYEAPVGGRIPGPSAGSPAVRPERQRQRG